MIKKLFLLFLFLWLGVGSVSATTWSPTIFPNSGILEGNVTQYSSCVVNFSQNRVQNNSEGQAVSGYRFGGGPYNYNTTHPIMCGHTDKLKLAYNDRVLRNNGSWALYLPSLSSTSTICKDYRGEEGITRLNNLINQGTIATLTDALYYLGCYRDVVKTTSYQSMVDSLYNEINEENLIISSAHYDQYRFLETFSIIKWMEKDLENKRNVSHTTMDFAIRSKSYCNLGLFDGIEEKRDCNFEAIVVDQNFVTSTDENESIKSAPGLTNTRPVTKEEFMSKLNEIASTSDFDINTNTNEDYFFYKTLLYFYENYVPPITICSIEQEEGMTLWASILKYFLKNTILASTTNGEDIITELDSQEIIWNNLEVINLWISDSLSNILDDVFEDEVEEIEDMIGDLLVELDMDNITVEENLACSSIVVTLQNKPLFTNALTASLGLFGDVFINQQQEEVRELGTVIIGDDAISNTSYLQELEFFWAGSFFLRSSDLILVDMWFNENDRKKLNPYLSYVLSRMFYD